MPLLALLTPRAIGVAVVGLFVLMFLGAFTWTYNDLQHAKTVLAQERADRARVEAERERVAREAEARIAKLQADNAAATQALSDAYAEDLKKREAAVAAAAADGDSLRADIQRLTADRTVGAATDAAQCRRIQDRAAALGHVLIRTDRFAEKLTGRAEELGGQVRLLKQQLMADRAACEP